MHLLNRCCKLMKYQGMLQESSLALSGSSATSSKTEHLAADYTITTNAHAQHLFVIFISLAVHLSIMNLIPCSRSYLMTYKHTTLIYIILNNKCTGNSNKVSED